MIIMKHRQWIVLEALQIFTDLYQQVRIVPRDQGVKAIKGKPDHETSKPEMIQLTVPERTVQVTVNRDQLHEIRPKYRRASC